MKHLMTLSPRLIVNQLVTKSRHQCFHCYGQPKGDCNIGLKRLCGAATPLEKEQNEKAFSAPWNTTDPIEELFDHLDLKESSGIWRTSGNWDPTSCNSGSSYSFEIWSTTSSSTWTTTTQSQSCVLQCNKVLQQLEHVLLLWMGCTFMAEQ
jgi:hypothetical protein